MFSCFLFLALLQFCLFLNHRDITTAHEGRVAAAAREMLADHDWIVPHANGQPRIIKPPLPYWVTATTWKLAGQVDAALARLPAALGGALAVVLVMDLGRRLLGREGGVVAGLVWISTWFIVDEYRKAMADPYLAFFTLLSVWSWVAAHDRSTPGHSAAPPRTALVLLAYISAALGALAKGPVILLHLALALIPYHIICRRRPANPIAHALGLILFLSIAAPWPATVARRVPNAIDVWRTQLRAEQATSGEKSSPPWAYLAALPQTSAPWMIFGLVGVLMPIAAKHRRDRRALWPLIWLAASVLVFSLLPMKKNTYLLPAMPAQTLIIAAPIVSALRSRRPSDGDRFLFAAHAVAAGAAFCFVLFLVLGSDRVALEQPGPTLAASGIGLFLVIGARSLSSRFISLRTFALTALGFALAVHGVEAWLIPESDNRRSDVPFADAVRVQTQSAPLYVIGEGLREDVLFYLGRTVPVIASPDQLPPDYNGYAIVTADQYPAVGKLDRSDEVGASAPERSAAKDRLVLVKFPKDPSRQQHRER